MKIFRFLRKQLLSSNKIGSYLKYALGEIALVVIGILIALNINNWNSLEIKRKEEIQTYQQIIRQISEDQKELIKVRDLNNYHTSQFGKAIQIISSKNNNKIDSLAILTMTLSQYSDFNSGGYIYVTLVNSGDIKLLKNMSISNKLQKLEMTYSNINKLEDIHWEIIMKELSPEVKGVIDYVTLEVLKPEKLYAIALQNIFVECVFLTKAKDAIYNQCLNEMETLIELLNNEIILKN
ncbi:MAG: hypothetical protein IZT56_10985 [Bacteroidetes bacterium]|nr:hypothetical protein [Bacteroidota bacterium]